MCIAKFVASVNTHTNTWLGAVFELIVTVPWADRELTLRWSWADSWSDRALSWSWAYLELIVSVPWANRERNLSWSWAYVEVIVSVPLADCNLPWANRERALSWSWATLNGRSSKHLQLHWGVKLWHLLFDSQIFLSGYFRVIEHSLLHFDLWTNRDCWKRNIQHWGWHITKGHENGRAVPFVPDFVYVVSRNTAA